MRSPWTSSLPFPLWNAFSIEWSPQVGAVLESGRLQLPPPVLSSSSSSSSPTLTPFVKLVFPDLPQVYTESDRQQFLKTTMPSQRIHTVAACRYETSQSLLDRVHRILEDDLIDENVGEEETTTKSSSFSTILLVGGNDKDHGVVGRGGSGGRTRSLTTIQAAEILNSHFPSSSDNSSNINNNIGGGDRPTPPQPPPPSIQVWGVENPNDPSSPQRFEAKRRAGIGTFLTQPLLTSTAMDTLHAYYHSQHHQHYHLLQSQSYYYSENEKNDLGSPGHPAPTLLAGMALPQSAKSLQFWAKLIDQQQQQQQQHRYGIDDDDEDNDVNESFSSSHSSLLLLQDDPLFQSHLAYFSQPYHTSLAWAGRELHDLYTRSRYNDDNNTTRIIPAAAAAAAAAGDDDHDNLSGEKSVVRGVHFMPLKNTDALCTIFQSLWRSSGGH